MRRGKGTKPGDEPAVKHVLSPAWESCIRSAQEAADVERNERLKAAEELALRRANDAETAQQSQLRLFRESLLAIAQEIKTQLVADIRNELKQPSTVAVA
jgi:hypothetical protein